MMSILGKALLTSPAVRRFSATSIRVNLAQQTPTIGHDHIAYPVYRAQVYICGQVYQKWREMGWKRYKDAPQDGIKVEVEYADNGLVVGNQEEPAVLILPGAPGSHKDFKHLIRDLTQRGSRVIAIDFPNFSLTKESKYFRHSPEEKADLVKAVLQTTGLNRFDLVVAHSSGVYPSVELWKDPDGPEIKSFAWFNPVGHTVLKAIQPYWFFKAMVKAYQTTPGRFVFEKAGPPLLRAIRQPFLDKNMDNIMLGAFTMYYSNYPEFLHHLLSIKENQFPLLFVCSDNDGIIGLNNFRQIVHALGSDLEFAEGYTKEGLLETKGSLDEDNWLKLIRFKAGSHFAFLKYPNLINYAVRDHMDRLKKACPQVSAKEHRILLQL